MNIILASQSPRRKELLSNLGFSFQTVSLDVQEDYPQDLEPSMIAGFLSQLKAQSFRELSPGELLITADTIVVSGGRVLGKPTDKEQAMSMIMELSNSIHQVYTAVSIRTIDDCQTFTDVAEVEFLPILKEEVEFYIENYKPMDKAGAYGVQEWLGMAKIKRINGSFYTIMGMPTHLIYQELKRKINASDAQ